MPIPVLTAKQPEQPVVTPAGTPPEKTEQKKSRKVWKIIVLMIVVVVVLVYAAIIFQPNIYLWIVKSVPDAKKMHSETSIKLDRKLTPLEGSSSTQAPYSDSVAIGTQASYVSPNTWDYSTNVRSGTTIQGIEAKMFDKTVYQRAYGSKDAFAQSTFTDQEYKDTVAAITSSSFSQKGLYPFSKNARFVWNNGGQPFWMVHYRYTVSVVDLENAKPDWYAPELYPFASESPDIAAKDITFVVDQWINPLTGKVTHEVWNVQKKTVTSDKLQIELNVNLDRSISYPSNLKIDKPS